MPDYKDDSIWLMKGDCLERMKEIPSGSVDMVLADPPYGTTQCKWDSVIPLAPMWEQLKRITKPNGAIVMTASQPFTSVLVCSNMKMFKYDWCWKRPKGTWHLNAKKRPMRDKEDILIFAMECHHITRNFQLVSLIAPNPALLKLNAMGATSALERTTAAPDTQRP